MSAIEDKAMELKLDRSDWELGRFGDVAIQQKQSVDRENTHLTRYVKGEHMSSEDIRLREWGNLEDEYLGPAFIRYFEKGDILYGSRRTYLRKVTIAPFEGITSNTTFVIKPNEDLIDKRLLPFVMLSEGFSQHSIRNSKGSVNPYVNWKDLANYEFLLPPKEQQAEIAQLLWAVDEVVETKQRAILSTLKLKESMQKYLFRDPRFTKTHLHKFCSVLGGFAFPSKKFLSKGTPVIKIKNIVAGQIEIDPESNCIDEDEFNNIGNFRLAPGDILIAMTGATLGKVGVVNDDLLISYLNQRVGKFVAKDGVDMNFMDGVFDSAFFRNELNKYIGEGAQGNISSDDIEKALVPDLNPNEMVRYGCKFLEMNKSMLQQEVTMKSSKSLQQSLINQVF